MKTFETVQTLHKTELKKQKITYIDNNRNTKNTLFIKFQIVKISLQIFRSRVLISKDSKTE